MIKIYIKISVRPGVIASVSTRRIAGFLELIYNSYFVGKFEFFFKLICVITITINILIFMFIHFLN